MAGVRLWVFGAGTALASAARDNTSLALEVDSGCWLIDCSGSPYQRLLRAGIDPLGLRGVLLTHSHPDHLYGLPALFFQLMLAGYQGTVPIYGLPETLRLSREVVAAFELGEHCVAHEWRELMERERWVDNDITIEARSVRHSRPALGFRLETVDGHAFVYSGDTGPCPALVELARNACWLVHECTVGEPLEGHSTPEQVAEVARQAGAVRLGIVHYDPAYVMPVEELMGRIQRAGFTGETRVLEDMDALRCDS